MKLIPSIKLIKKAEEEGYAIPSFTVWNVEMMKTVLSTAQEMQSPVIFLTGPSEFDLFRPKMLFNLASMLVKNYTIPVSIHLDHGNSLNMVSECIDAGYPSLMLDFSSKSYEENAGALKKVVEMAKPLGITVEGEIGSIGKADQMSPEGVGISGLTNPEEAKKYVHDTGVDMLAIGIGNAHGIYKSLPKFDFARLKEIHELVKIPLVLHGGSGTPKEDLIKAISLGIAKVNVASELVKALRDSLIKQWNEGKNMWIPQTTAEALKELPPIIEKWIKNLGSADKA